MSAAKKTKVSSDLLMEARLEFHDLIELIGAASGQLREALGDQAAGNLGGAAIVADDLVMSLSELEVKASALAAKVSRWQLLAEQTLEAGGAA